MRKILVVVCLLVFLYPGFCQDKKPLRWATDPTGGAPYIFDNNTKGFELELATYFADELGMKSTIAIGEWSKLPGLLNINQADIVLNGYELTSENKEISTLPYYQFSLTLVVNSKSPIQKWDDLKQVQGKPKKKVGVLTGSAAYRYMEEHFNKEIDLQVFDDVANTFELVEMERLDAVVQDNPAAIYFVVTEENEKLRIVNEKRDDTKGAYVILTNNQDLKDRINDAILKGFQSGKFKEIYQKYGIWNGDQEELALNATSKEKLEAVSKREKLAQFDRAEVITRLIKAALVTILLAVTSMPLAIVVGLVVACIRVYGPAPLRVIFTVYVEVLRGTPLILQLYVLFYVLPQYVKSIQEIPYFGYWIGIIGLAMNYSASQAEHFRGALQNLPKGQFDAALALGMTRLAAVRVVLIPQAVRAAIPSVTNDFIALFKDTSVCSVISVFELAKQYNTDFNAFPKHAIELVCVTAALYLCMSYPLALIARRLEKKVSEAVK